MTTHATDQEKLDRDKAKEVEAYEKDPEGVTKKEQEAALRRQADDMAAMSGQTTLKEDINSMVHPDKNDPVEARGSGKDGVPAGTEDYLKATRKQKVDDDGNVKELHAGHATSDRSTDPKDKDAAVTVDPADGSKRTKDGVK